MNPAKTIHLVEPDKLSAFPGVFAPLLPWYDKNARDLPWRKSKQPYGVWISEIMLQQTRVEAVIPYYNRFMRALPTVADLARVDEEVLLKLWEGLGYYSRARNLKKAAMVLMAENGGLFPASFGELLALPGIGPYTAGAVASICFDQPVPAVDGNVYRVLARVVASDECISEGAVQTAFYALAKTILPPDRPGDFNQALMELGATVCLPGGAPKCALCPLAENCAAKALGTMLDLPVKAAKKARKVAEKTILVIHFGQRFLLRKRGAKGVLAGMWELPWLDGVVDLPGAKAGLEAMGCSLCAIEALPPAKHIFTHLEWQMTGFAITLAAQIDLPDCVWVTQTDLDETFALPSAFSPYRQYL